MFLVINIFKKAGLVIAAFIFIFCLPLPVSAHGYAMSYLYGGTTTQYQNYMQHAGSVLDSISPDYFEINSDGTLSYGKIDSTFVRNMQGQNKSVIPFISNHWDRPLGIAALDNTEGLTTQIAQVVNTYNLDGINVDIENVSHLHRDAYTNFVKRLRDKMPNKTIAVSVAANPYNWQVGWHGSYDYAALSQYSDYLVIMGYDESYSGGPAGPVASGTFVEKSIEYALKYTTPSKLVLSIPFYGRFWKEGDATGGYGIASMDIENLIQNYKTRKVYHADSQSAQLTLTLTAGEVMPKLWGGRTLTPGVYNIWYDDTTATKYKLDLVEKYKLKGSGSWALGQEVKDIWSTYAEYKTAQETPSTANCTIKYSSHLQNLGWEKDYTKENGQISGTVGQSRRLEAIKIMLKDAPAGASLSYQVHVQNLGWQNWVSTGAIAGTTGKSLRVECIRIKLNNMAGYHVEYRAHVQNLGWQKWVQDGVEAGTTGRSLRLEALQIRIVPDSLSAISYGEYLDPAEDIINRGWFSASEYQADKTLTRADAVKLIMRMAVKLPQAPDSTENFDDVINHPDKDFILKAKYYGIINGDSANNFYPDHPISRKDFSILMDRVFSLPDTVDFDSNKAKDISKEDDSEGYYAINKYLEHAIMNVDKLGNFRPNDTLSMRDAAIIAQRLINTGINDLVPITSPEQQQPQKILEPR